MLFTIIAAITNPLNSTVQSIFSFEKSYTNKHTINLLSEPKVVSTISDLYKIQHFNTGTNWNEIVRLMEVSAVFFDAHTAFLLFMAELLNTFRSQNLYKKSRNKEWQHHVSPWSFAIESFRQCRQCKLTQVIERYKAEQKVTRTSLEYQADTFFFSFFLTTLVRVWLVLCFVLLLFVSCLFPFSLCLYPNSTINITA